MDVAGEIALPCFYLNRLPIYSRGMLRQSSDETIEVLQAKIKEARNKFRAG
jgi:hypothetical protein